METSLNIFLMQYENKRKHKKFIHLEFQYFILLNFDLVRYLKLNVVKGLYDLCDSFNRIGIPQKSLKNISTSGELPDTSLLNTIAGKSS